MRLAEKGLGQVRLRPQPPAARGFLLKRGAAQEDEARAAHRSQSFQSRRRDAPGASGHDDHVPVGDDRAAGLAGRQRRRRAGKRKATVHRRGAQLRPRPARKQFAQDDRRQDFGRSARLFQVDRLDRRLGPLGRGGLGQARQAAKPRPHAASGEAEIPARVLDGDEDAAGLSRLGERFGGLERLPLDMHGLVCILDRTQPTHEDRAAGVGWDLRGNDHFEAVRPKRVSQRQGKLGQGFAVVVQRDQQRQRACLPQPGQGETEGGSVHHMNHLAGENRIARGRGNLRGVFV